MELGVLHQRKRNPPAPSAGTGNVEIRSMLDAQICAAGNKHASAGPATCARCVWGRVEPDHRSVSESYSRHYAFAATVAIIGAGEASGLVHKGNQDLALAESYCDNRPETKQNLETILECIPHPRRWLFFY
jgi:hypothetical protein